MKNTVENLKAAVKENESLNAQYKELKAFENKINNMVLLIGNPYRNLKVYDISGYLYDLQQKGILTYNEMVNKFNLICEMEYEYFQEEESEMTNLIEREYIGRTSTFVYVFKSDLNMLSLESSNYSYEPIDIDIVFDDLAYNGYDSTDDLIDDMFFEFDELHDDLVTIEKALKEIQIMLNIIDNYQTKENEYLIVEHYMMNKIEDGHLQTIEDIKQSTWNFAMNKKHETKGVACINNICITEEDENYKIIVVVDGVPTVIETLEYKADDLSDAIIAKYHEALEIELEQLKKEFDY